MNLLAVCSGFGKWGKLPPGGTWAERRTHNLSDSSDPKAFEPVEKGAPVAGNQDERGPEIGDKETGFQRTCQSFSPGC